MFHPKVHIPGSQQPPKTAQNAVVEHKGSGMRAVCFGLCSIEPTEDTAVCVLGRFAPHLGFMCFFTAIAASRSTCGTPLVIEDTCRSEQFDSQKKPPRRST
jgi:hypothetical protein